MPIFDVLVILQPCPEHSKNKIARQKNYVEYKVHTYGSALRYHTVKFPFSEEHPNVICLLNNMSRYLRLYRDT